MSSKSSLPIGATRSAPVGSGATNSISWRSLQASLARVPHERQKCETGPSEKRTQSLKNSRYSPKTIALRTPHRAIRALASFFCGSRRSR
jgi:hypothetical protein